MAIEKLTPRSSQLYGLAMGTIVLCVALWIRAKTIGEDERGNAERRALFVGLWPAMIWLLGDALRRSEEQRARTGLAGMLRRTAERNRPRRMRDRICK